MFCLKCGKEIIDGSVYCSFCGAEQALEEEREKVCQEEKMEPPLEDSSEESSPDPGPKHSLLHTFIIAFNILVVIVCLSIIFVVLAQWISPQGNDDASSSAPVLSSSFPTDGFLSEYEYAEFDTYNSPAEENGLGDKKIFTTGIIEKSETIDTCTFFLLKTSDGDYWSCGVAAIGDLSEQLSSAINKEEVIVYGTYLGFSNKHKMPSLYLEYVKIGDDVVDGNSLIKTTTTTSRATTTAPKPTAKSGTVLYKDNKVAIRFEDVTRESWYGDYVIVFSVENKTNQTLTFQAESMAVDGISLSSSKLIMSDEVAPQSTGRIYLKTEESVPLEPKKISGELRVIDFESDDYSKRSYNAKFVNVSLQ